MRLWSQLRLASLLLVERGDSAGRRCQYGRSRRHRDIPARAGHAARARRNVFAALSLGNRFARSMTWHSDFAGNDQARLQSAIVRSPLIGNFFGTTLGDITDVAADHQRRLPDIFAFRNDAAVHVSTAMANIPYLPAAPWEYYKWFTEKGIGVGLYPEWIWQAPNHCLSVNHRFAVQGLAGSGSGDLTISSVRIGGRSGHIEELGHSVFANCFRQTNDVFNLFSSIFETSTENGGIDANNMPDCPNSFYDCNRPPAAGALLSGALVEVPHPGGRLSRRDSQGSGRGPKGATERAVRLVQGALVPGH